MIIRLDRLINWVKRYGFTIGMLCLAMGIGFLSVRKSITPILLLIAAFYFLIIFARPIWGYMIMIFVICNAFGIINLDYFSVTGMFKLTDVSLLALFPVIFANIVVKRDTIKYIKTPFNKYILLLSLFILFVVCYTMFEFEVSLESSIRLARKYLFYLSFFAILYYIQDIADIKKFLFIFIALAVCCSSLFYTQFFVGSRFKIMRYLLMDYQQLGGFYILRIYLAGSTPLLCLSFAICFWLTQCYTTQKKVRVFLILSFFLGIALFLCFSRARWVMQFLIIAVPFFFATKYEKAKTLKLTLITACIGFIILIVAQAVGVDFLTHLTKLIQRIESTYYEIIHQTGTFGYRLEDSFQRINMFLKRPLLGVGFLHHLAALESPKAAFVKDYLVETIDSGLITLLVTMGLGGVAVFSIVLIGFFTRSIKIIRVNNSPLLRGICLGCLGYIAGATLTFITLPCFTSLNEIPYITLAFALVEKVSQFNTPEE